jgi:aldose 1-epimerase
MKKNKLLCFAAICALALSGAFTSRAQTKAPGELLDKADFETEIDGKPVSLYTITNGRITAQITNLAGYIVGIWTPDKDGNYTNVVGHNDNIQQYRGFSRNPVGAALGRYANRIGNATFTLDGVTYNTTRNNGAHTLHGGTAGFDRTVWDVEEASENTLVLSCTLADSLDGFPGTLKTFLTFSVTEDDGVSIDYRATTDKPTVCNLSHHVYFNLDGFPAENVLGHVIRIDADTMTEMDATLIPTGKILPVEGTPFDFRRPVLLSERQVAPAARGAFVPGAQLPPVPEGMVRSFDQNFCLNHGVTAQPELAATVYSPASGRVMEVLNDKPGLQFYTGGRTALALESQLYPDALNHPAFPGSSVLRPGETYRHTVIYRFSVRE